MNHDDPAYLDGLTELDRARAIIRAIIERGRELHQQHRDP